MREGRIAKKQFFLVFPLFSLTCTKLIASRDHNIWFGHVINYIFTCQINVPRFEGPLINGKKCLKDCFQLNGNKLSFVNNTVCLFIFIFLHNNHLRCPKNSNIHPPSQLFLYKSYNSWPISDGSKRVDWKVEGRKVGLYAIKFLQRYFQTFRIRFLPSTQLTIELLQKDIPHHHQSTN